MNITIAAPSSIPARRANTIQTMKMAQAFAALGHKIFLAVPQFPDAYRSNPNHSIDPSRHNDDGWQQLAKHYGIRHPFPIRYFSTHPSLRHYDFSLKVLYWARQNSSHLIYSRLPQTAALASTLNFKTVFEIHDMPQGRMGAPLLRRYLKGRGAVRLVAITASLAHELSQKFKSPVLDQRTTIAPDGVDLERYRDIPDPPTARKRLKDSNIVDNSFPRENFTAGYTGHLYRGRCIELILETAARLPSINFLVAGGENGQIIDLKDAAVNAGLSNLFTAGFVPNADLPLVQAACDALMMPYQGRVAASSGGDISRYLSPMKLFEYMACGRAILASDLPVLKEILNPGNAVLLAPDDLNAWVNGLKSLESDPTLRESLAAQARTDAAKYSWDKRASRILEGL